MLTTHLYNAAQPPTTIPEPAAEDLSPAQHGAHQGRAWDPARGVVRRTTNPAFSPAVTKPPPDPQPTSPGARPSTGERAGTTAVATDPPAEELGNQNRGLHVVQAPGVTIPHGKQSVEPARRNTWRAAPQPWDTGVYVGVPTS